MLRSLLWWLPLLILPDFPVSRATRQAIAAGQATTLIRATTAGGTG
jgi:hypothetical protein